jgi:hypothetical protein
MSKKSVVNKIVRKSAEEIPPASKADLDRLRAAMQGSIDTSEIRERRKFHRLKRDGSGGLPLRKSIIRDAVTRQMQHLRLTVYRLWQLARAHYPPLSQAAVHEFLKGQRQLELPSIEALLAAVHLRVVRRSVAQRGRTQRGTKQGAKKSVPSRPTALSEHTRFPTGRR